MLISFKAVREKNYVEIYSKLCKDLDKDLPQKSDKAGANNTKTSVLRSKLLEKCKRIFKEELENIEEYIGKNLEQDEKEFKMKQFVLGSKFRLILSLYYIYFCLFCIFL